MTIQSFGKYSSTRKLEKNRFPCEKIYKLILAELTSEVQQKLEFHTSEPHIGAVFVV